MASTIIQGIELKDELPTKPGVYLIAMNPTSGQLYMGIVSRIQGKLWGQRVGMDGCAYPLEKIPGQRSSMFRGTWWARRDP